jgi:hypothetical protein
MCVPVLWTDVSSRLGAFTASTGGSEVDDTREEPFDFITLHPPTGEKAHRHTAQSKAADPTEFDWDDMAWTQEELDHVLQSLDVAGVLAADAVLVIDAPASLVSSKYECATVTLTPCTVLITIASAGYKVVLAKHGFQCPGKRYTILQHSTVQGGKLVFTEPYSVTVCRRDPEGRSNPIDYPISEEDVWTGSNPTRTFYPPVKDTPVSSAVCSAHNCRSNRVPIFLPVVAGLLLWEDGPVPSGDIGRQSSEQHPAPGPGNSVDVPPLRQAGEQLPSAMQWHRHRRVGSTAGRCHTHPSHRLQRERNRRDTSARGNVHHPSTRTTAGKYTSHASGDDGEGCNTQT